MTKERLWALISSFFKNQMGRGEKGWLLYMALATELFKEQP